MPSALLTKKKIDTLEKKLDYMYMRLGGEDLEKGKEIDGLKNLDEYQQQVLDTRSRIKTIRKMIDERNQNIKIHGYQSKDRIIADQKIKKSIEDWEEDIQTIEIIVKKKAAKYSEQDLNNRKKTVVLLRKNLDLLRTEILGNKEDVPSEFEERPNKKIFGDYKNTDEDQVSQGDIKVDIGSDNASEENKYEDRELTDEEKQALKKFKENDEELDAVLDRIIIGLSELQNKGNIMNEQINRQGEMLDKTNKKVEKTALRLREQNSHLKDVLQKVRSTNKLCWDVCLILWFLGLIAVIISILKA